MSGDVMNFPNTWEEYEEQYGFNDKEQIYTNGSRLIQSFRVKQWLEHIEVSEDCISREWIFDALLKYGFTAPDMTVTELIEDAPSVVPKRGAWKAKSFHECFCDNCGFIFDIMKCDFLENMKFCPNCGAKMKGADDEA